MLTGASRRSTLLLLAAFSLTYLALQVGSIRARSATFDEAVHLAAGYAAVTKGDYQFEITHPPLIRMWAALPLLVASPGPLPYARIDTDTIGRRADPAYAAAQKFLFGTPGGPALLDRARMMIALLGVGLGLLLYSWVRELFGAVTATLVLGTYLVSPNLAAHAGLVTTDFGLTLSFTGTIYFLWRLQRAYTGRNLAGLCLFFAFALTCKYSAVLLGPLVAVLLLAAVRFRTAITIRRALAVLGLMSTTAVVAIWAAYQFRYEAAPGSQPLRADLVPWVRESVPFLASVLGWIDQHHLLPASYTQGFILCQASAKDLTTYLDGSVKIGAGWWYYFPAAFFYKSPLVRLLLLALGLFYLCRPSAKLRLPWIERLIILVPPALYLGFAMASDINIGLRHILPVMPFVLLIVGYAIRELLEYRRVVIRSALATAAGLLGFAFASVYPYTLTFFNYAVGGSAAGPKFLADSNLDWGQGLKALRGWMEEGGVERINLAYFGSVDPRAYGIRSISLPGTSSYQGHQAPDLPGYVAISPTVLALAARDPALDVFYGGFRSLEPDEIVGNTLRIYWVNEWPMPAEPIPTRAERVNAYRAVGDHVLTRLNWSRQAARYYRSYLRARPKDAKAHKALGVALAAQGLPRDAEQQFNRALALEPNDSSVQELLHRLQREL